MTPLHIACWDYDRVLALRTGEVGVEGHELRFEIRYPGSHAFRTSDGAAFDAMEMSFSNYLAARARGEDEFVALPVFLSRMFRHSAIYIRANAGIEHPRDMLGARAGVPFFGQTAALAARGILHDEHRIQVEDMEWVAGPLEPGDATVPIEQPSRAVRLRGSVGAFLADMLLDGRLDALISAAAPRLFEEGDARIKRLWRDTRATERDYYRRTGIFPIMHVLAVRRDLLDQRPGLARALYEAFDKARALAIAALDGRWGAARVSLPWSNDELAATKALMGPDFWSYGVANNRRTLEAMTRWSFEQGLSPRKLAVEDLFAPELLDT